MMAGVAERTNLVDELYRSLDEVPPDQMMAVIRRALGEAIDATDVVLVLADYAEESLERFDHARSGAPSETRSLPIGSTVPGECFRRQEVVVEAADGAGPRWSICAPVTVRSERFGVLEVQLTGDPAPEDRAAIAQVASALGYVIASARRYTDVFERVRRRRHLTLAAEMQWELLPVLGYDAPALSIAGSLEPAYDIGGDSFDYAVDGDRLTVSISDAMGRGLRAALCATLAVTAMRNIRRAGDDILKQADAANRVLCEQFGDHIFVTSLLLEVDIPSGRGIAVNAGHPLPWRLLPESAGPLELDADPPLGMFEDTRFRSQAVQLVPGERLVLVTDGIIEAGPDRDQPFGVDRLAALVASRRATPPRELVRQVTRAVLAHRDAELLDDASLVCLDWTGPRS